MFTVGNLGFYKFTHVPFGLCNTLATFQCLMQNMLGELNLMYCIIYLDDVIVFSCTQEELLKCLQIIFERFCKFNLKLKPSKCLFSNQKLYTWIRWLMHESCYFLFLWCLDLCAFLSLPECLPCLSRFFVR